MWNSWKPQQIANIIMTIFVVIGRKNTGMEVVSSANLGKHLIVLYGIDFVSKLQTFYILNYIDLFIGNCKWFCSDVIKF